jgi:inner membrane protein involved in colicin E2 resistance
MDIDWGNSGTTAPFKALDAKHLDLDVTNTSIGSHHRIQVDPKDIDITALASDPSIVAAASGDAQFAITGQHGGATNNFSSFADFEAALAMDLNGTTTALRLTADGQYDAASNTFTARRITILLSN